MKKSEFQKPEVGNGFPAKSEPNDSLVVGIGASAGGIKALKEFFAAMPSDSGIAFVVILHLSEEHESSLAQILQTNTAMPVIQITETIKVEPNHVYVIPPAKGLAMVDGTIQLTEPTHIKGKRVPIDLFFRTLADAYGKNGIAVVLSGTGSDGTLGLERVKEHGGIGIAQEPSEAEYDGMPRSAINTGLVDLILPVGEMPARIIALRQNGGKIRLPKEKDKITPATNGKEPDALQAILAIVRVRTGHDFSNYKHATVLRRIARRLQVHGLAELPEYLEFLRENEDEAQQLQRDLLISVTNFFRDKEAFEVLEREVIPKLFAGKTSADTVRVWSVGCATGDEAYSLAILLDEFASGITDAPKIQIFASDINEQAIAAARDCFYDEPLIADVSPTRLRRYFVKEGGCRRVRKQLRETVLFAPHNILRDPPFSKLDLIVCRNLLIYFNRETQEKVLGIFNFALRGNGYLFLGASESAENSPALFSVTDKKYRIYKARPAAHFQPPPAMPSSGKWNVRIPQLPIQVSEPQPPISYGEIHVQLVEQFAPPSVLVNEEYEIVHVSEHAGRFLHVAGGSPTRDLLKIIHPSLKLDLQSALFEAKTGKFVSESRNIRFRGRDEGGGMRDKSKKDDSDSFIPHPSALIPSTETLVNITVRLLQSPETAAGFYLVIFNESKVEAAPEETGQHPQTIAGRDAVDNIVSQLEKELQINRERLRTTIEQNETSSEELKASNEEMQAMNEELRSASEELETGKEELQSLNEELMTVNAELKDKVSETVRINSDLQNLIQSTDIGTIFLDRNLRIKRFTPRIGELFNVIGSDIGRPLEHLTHQLDYDLLNEDAAEVLQTLRFKEREVCSGAGDSCYLVRLAPYRTLDDKIDGVVLSFQDITDLKRAGDLLSVSETRLRLLIESAKEYAIFTTDLERRVNSWNVGAETMFGYAESEIIGQSADVLFTPEDRAAGEVEREVETAAAEGRAANERWHIRRDGSRFYGSGSVMTLRDDDGKLLGFTKIMRDLTVQKNLEAALQAAEERTRLIIESAQDYAIFSMTDDGSVDTWNTGAERIFGWTDTEILGQPAEILFTPEDRAAGIPQKEISTAAETGRASGERWHIRKDDTRFYASGVMVGLRDGERLHGFAKIARDLTEQKRREANLAFLAEVSQDLVRLTRVDEMMNQLGAKIGGHFNVARCILAEVLESENRAIYWEWHRPELSKTIGETDYSQFVNEEYIRRSRAGETIVVPDAYQSPMTDGRALEEFFATTSFVTVPLLRDGQWRFTLGIYDSAPRDWQADEIELIQELTTRIWTRFERARAEESLRESQSHLRLALDAAEMGTFLWYPQEDRTELDARMLRLFGLREGETLNHAAAFAKIVHPDDRESLAAAIAVALDPNGDGKLEADYRVIHPDGSLHWLNSQGQTFFEGENPPRASLIYGMVLDITTRKRHEANLAFLADTSADFAPLFRAEEIMERVGKRLADHLNLSRCNFSIVDEEADHIECLYDWRRDDSMPDLSGAHRISTFLSEQGRRHYAAGNFAVINDVRNSSLLNPATFEKFDELGLRSVIDAPYLKNGRWKFLLTAARSEASEWRTDEIELIRELAERVYIRVERARAEEALRESEEKYRQLFDSIDEGFCIIEVLYDESGRAADFVYLETNPAFAAQSGLENVVGRRISEIIPTLDQFWYEIYGKVALSGESARFEHEVTELDRKYDIFASRIGDDSSRKIAIVFQDITERKRDEDQIQHTGKTFFNLIQNAPFGVYLVNSELLLVEVSAAANKVFSNVHPLLNRDFAEVLQIVWTEPFLSETLNRFRHTLATGEEYHSADTVEERNDTNETESYDWLLKRITMPDGTFGVVCYFWDMTDRRRAERALRESEGRLRALVENLPGGAVFIVDKNLRYLIADGEALANAGFAPEDLVGRTVNEAMPPELAASYESLYRTALAGEAFEHEHDAHGRAFITRGLPLKSAAGEVYAVLAISYDITERKQAEENLRESEEKYRGASEFNSAVLSSLTAQIAVLDADGDIATVNEEWRRFSSKNGGEHARTGVGANYLEVCRRADGDSADDARRVLAGIQSILQGEIAQFSHEYPCHSPVEKRFFLLNVTPLQGGRGGAVVSHLNITTRKLAEQALYESEERLRLVINSVEDYAITTTDAAGVINGWNPGAEKMFGYAESEIIGQPYEILYTPEDREKGVPAMELQTAFERGSVEDERLHTRKDGSRFFSAGVIQIFKDGKIDGFVKISRDMTERIQAEQIGRDKEMLQKLVGAQEDERKRIARDLHDELGQLLTGLRLKLEAVGKLCGDNEELRGKIDETQTIAKHLDAGIDFLAWELRPAALDDLGLRPALAKYVREWSHYTGVTAELLGSNVKKTRLSPEAETNLYRIAQEALNNVHKHANAESVEVSLDKRGDDFVVLIIADDGKGFDTADKTNRGKGIGLIGMRERAALIGGSLEIESAPGNGTTIFVRVPVSFMEKENLDDE